MNFFRKKNRAVDESNKDELQHEKRIASEWYRKFLEAKSNMKDKHDLWKKCIDSYKGDYFDNDVLPEYKGNLIANHIFATVETIKPIMTDNNPKFVALPRTRKGMEIAPKIQMAFDYEWARTKMQLKLPEALTCVLQTGSVIFSPVWDGTKSRLGEVKPLLINPFNIYVDPLATCFEDAEYVIYAKYIHVNKLKLLFPHKADVLVSESIEHTDLVPDGEMSQVNNQILVMEVWCRDYTTIETEESEDGTIKKKLKYPKGRVITCTKDVVLSDKANPYDDGKFPFIMIKCYDIPFEFWGMGEIEQLLSIQKYINELSNQVIDNAKLTANQVWILDKNSGIEKGKLSNRPGLIVRKNPGTEVRRDAPPAMPGYVGDMIANLKDTINDVSGIHDSIQGRRDGSVTAASAILALQEASQARIRLKVRIMEASLGELAKMWYSRMQQFWITERWVRIVDANNKPAFESITIDDLKEDMDIIVTSGSTMPQNKTAMLDLMIRLSQTQAEDGMPMVDRETILQFVPMVNKTDVLEKFNQLKQSQEQMAQMQEQLQQLSMENEQLKQMLGDIDFEDKKLQNELTKMKEQSRIKIKEEMMKKEFEKEDGNEDVDIEVENKDKLDKITKYLLQLDEHELQMFLANNPEFEQLIINSEQPVQEQDSQGEVF